MGPKRNRQKKVQQQVEQGYFGYQSEVKQYQSGTFNLKQNEFNEQDYALEGWISRKFTFNDYKKEFLRGVNGPQRPVNLGDESQWFLGLAADDYAQKLQNQRHKQSKIRQNQVFLEKNDPNLYQSLVDEGLNFTISDKNQSLGEASSLQKSSITINSNEAVQQADKMANNVIQIESEYAQSIEEDSSETYFVSQKKTKKNNIDLQEEDKQTHGPGLSNLILQTLKERQKKKYKQSRFNRKLQTNQTKKAFLIPQQQLIKLDD